MTIPAMAPPEMAAPAALAAPPLAGDGDGDGDGDGSGAAQLDAFYCHQRFVPTATHVPKATGAVVADFVPVHCELRLK